MWWIPLIILLCLIAVAWTWRYGKRRPWPQRRRRTGLPPDDFAPMFSGDETERGWTGIILLFLLILVIVWLIEGWIRGGLG